MTVTERLAAGLAELGLVVPDGAQGRLLAFIDLLVKWNRTYSLTSVRAPEDMVTLHLLDSLAVIPAIEKSALVARRLCDVGSGAGLPGIPLAIVRPEWQILSVEAVEKKAAFQRQTKIELGIPNLVVESRRVETLPAGGHNAVISRAFSDLPRFIGLAGRLVDPGGHLLAMKGGRPDAEIEALPAGWLAREVVPLEVPGLAAQRHLVVLEKE